MTEQEMREKIVKVLKKSREEWEIITPSIGILDEPRVDIEIDKLADALIAAGIGDVSKWKAYAKVHRIVITKDDKIKQLYSDEEVDKIVIERAEYKHRAQVAERALRKAVSVLDAEYRAFGVNRENKTEQRIKNFIEQAEKELAEEGKDVE